MSHYIFSYITGEGSEYTSPDSERVKEMIEGEKAKSPPPLVVLQWKLHKQFIIRPLSHTKHRQTARHSPFLWFSGGLKKEEAKNN